jgi:uncharacterized peroxidase-related enzyme
MAFIETPADDGIAGELYDTDRRRQGYVANYTRVFAHRPRVYAAWQELNAAIKASMDLRRYELATVAAARQLRSSYCMLAHGKALAEQFYDAETVHALASDVSDRSGPELEPAEVAVMELAGKVAQDATAVTADDIDRLRRLGLSEADIMDVVLAAAARCFFSKTLDALGVEPDAAYWDLDPALRNALTVGRPIAAR